MKWVKPVYYIIATVLALFIIFLSIGFPPIFLITIPISAFLYAFPPLYLRAFYQTENLSKHEPKLNVSQNTPNIPELAMESRKQEYLEEQVSKLSTDNRKLQAKLNVYAQALKDDARLLTMAIPVMSGEWYERYVGSRLKLDGYTSIEYTPVTGDFGADIIAINREGARVCIQCKRYSDSVGVEAVQAAVTARMYYECAQSMVITNSTFTDAAKELARKTNTVLLSNFV